MKINFLNKYGTLIAIVVSVIIYVVFCTDLQYCEGGDASTVLSSNSTNIAHNDAEGLTPYAQNMLAAVNRVRSGTYTREDEAFIRRQFSSVEQTKVSETLREPDQDSHKLLQDLVRGAIEIIAEEN